MLLCRLSCVLDGGNALPSLQLEGVLYACSKHLTWLPSGERCGFFIGEHRPPDLALAWKLGSQSEVLCICMALQLHSLHVCLCAGQPRLKGLGIWAPAWRVPAHISGPVFLDHTRLPASTPPPGDGAGVGKGRQISGIVLDNYARGRRKSVWISTSTGEKKGW